MERQLRPSHSSFLFHLLLKKEKYLHKTRLCEADSLFNDYWNYMKYLVALLLHPLGIPLVSF